MIKNKWTHIIIFFSLICSANGSLIEIEQTPRLKSTGGVGVGAVLLDEATLLNPAPMAFYQIGAIFYQKNSRKRQDVSETSSSDYDSTLLIASDSKGRVGGSVSYDKREETKLVNVSLATPVSEKSSLGVTYRKYEGLGLEATSLDIGVSHAITEFFTLGAIVKNPQRNNNFDTRFILGTQFVYKDFIAVLFDLGSDWENTLNEDLVYGAGLQFKTFNDFYLRIGSSKDKKLKKTHSGVGLSWVSPRILLNFAISNILEENSDETIKDTSFSVSYKF